DVPTGVLRQTADGIVADARWVGAVVPIDDKRGAARVEAIETTGARANPQPTDTVDEQLAYRVVAQAVRVGRVPTEDVEPAGAGIQTVEPSAIRREPYRARLIRRDVPDKRIAQRSAIAHRVEVRHVARVLIYHVDAAVA